MKKYGWSNFKDLVLRKSAVVEQQDSHVDDGDENTVRGNWTNKREYILSMIGYAIGLGNIWRFPYLTYKNGGGAFLIPYFLMLVLGGIPLFFLESSLGQFCSQGPINTWRAVPILQGVGYCMFMVNALLAIYYNVIIAYGLYYMFASFQSPLPWTSCSSWADSNCSLTPIVKCNLSSLPVANWTQDNGTCPSSNIISIPVQSPTEQYWDRVVLQRSSGLDDTGPVVWHLALCLLLSMILVAAALLKGVKSSGKVVYFTATFPYVVIVILLIRGVTLEGARDGIEFYIGSQSNLTKLTEAEVWKDAATQTLYSLSIGWGGVTTLASYNKFHNNVFHDSVVVTLTNAGTSVFAGFAIFSVLGHMAHVYGKPVGEVAQEGFGLVFIVYPDALSKLPIAPFWSIMFFFMFFTLGLDSQFAGIEMISTCLLDGFPKLFQSRRSLITIVTCAIIFLLGLPCVTRAGIYWVTLMDQFVASWLLLIIVFLEIIGLCYIYGGNRFIQDIEMMIGSKSFCFWLWWRACWFFISPCLILVILVWSLLTFEPPNYGAVQYPAWGLALGWCMVAFCLVWIPVVAVYKLMRAEGNAWKRLKSVCCPSEDWHPFLEVHRGERYSEERCRRRKDSVNQSDADVNVISNSWL
ncbi:sodium- and chloride-dependent neutral and basic amino acid transporter B(0+) isoform X1 [Centroberyx affinis]|uniref:sodium- and chloride-dependent neutral and basic amino acid transporter B(0+) isoform X1 n=1 Tax=Centroberyx affinis TaxID=166261 RepID=UPI003A5B9DD7